MRKIWVFKTEHEKAHAFKAKTPSNIRIIAQENSNLTTSKQKKKKETQLSKFIK